MAQQCLQSKHTDVSLVPKTYIEVTTCNSSAGLWEAWGLTGG